MFDPKPMFSELSFGKKISRLMLHCLKPEEYMPEQILESFLIKSNDLLYLQKKAMLEGSTKRYDNSNTTFFVKPLLKLL